MHKSRRDSLLILGVAKVGKSFKPVRLTIDEKNEVMEEVKEILDEKNLLGLGYWV